MSGIPLIPRGALWAGKAAYALVRAIDEDKLARLIEAQGLGRSYQEAAAAAFKATRIEAGLWKRDEAGSATGTDPVPQSEGQASSPAMTETVTIATAAKRTGLSKSYLRRLARSDELSARHDGRAWRLDAAAVAELVAKRKERAA